LDPKSKLTDEHVITTNIAKMFGNVHKFKTNNPLLTMEIKRELEWLYWKIYGTMHTINNEIMPWLVKGWAIKHNGNPINWTKATASTAKEKV
jgi:hypothetical protein